MTANDPVAAFRIEAGELLDQVEQGLLDLGHRLDDMNVVNAVFRGLHTLKGSGAMFGFDALAGFTHHCESAFDQVRKGTVPATGEMVAVILSAGDHMRALVAGDAPVAVGDEILVRLARAVEAARGEPIGEVVASGSAQGWQMSFHLPADAMVNGTNPLMLLDELRALGDCMIVARTDAVPMLADLAVAEIHIGWDVTLIGDISREDIEDVFIFVMDDMTLSIEPIGVDPAKGDVVGDAPAAVAGVPAVAGDDPVVARGAIKPAGESVRVPAERLDALMDRVGELVIAQSRLSQLAQQDGGVAMRSISEEIERLAGELRDTMMVLRMVPVSQLFSRFRRLIHDLSRDTGKAIELVTEGEHTELDKTVIERLFDPLVHLIRNSCDHGLETGEQRLAAGKPEAGTVLLSAHQAGGEVVITIRDDGQGIDRVRVRAKAEAGGLIEPGQPLADGELLQLIFHPGFSTASAVTNLSGRGVGMDVVKRTIESLRGTIDVASVDGVGSTITLRITGTLRDANTRSEAMVGVIADTAASLSARLVNIRKIRANVQVIATNTGVLSWRMGPQGKAVSVIAAEVDGCASRLAAITGSVAETIGDLTGIETELRGNANGDGDGRRDMGETLAGALSIIRHACQQTDQVNLEGGDNVRNLADMLIQTGNQLQAELAIVAVLRAMAETLQYRLGEAEPDDTATESLTVLLPRIASLYTMAQERTVHARFLLPSMIAAAAMTAVVEEDEDDDGLF